MYPMILVRYGELSLKGRNRKFFENILVKNISSSLAGIPHGQIRRTFGRIYIPTAANWEQIARRLQQVFGIVSVSPVLKQELNLDQIKKGAVQVTQAQAGQTFKIQTRRANKSFPLTTPEINKALGTHILSTFPNLKVDVHQPDLTINVEIRQEGVFLYSEVIPCLGGLPTGSSGKGVLLLSGGIDSPVAGFLSMKRGVNVEGLHFHSYPFTSERSKEKVIELARQLSPYNTGGTLRLWIASFTKIQKALRQTSYPSLAITLMRRFMIRIGTALANKEGAYALITGDSLGQVASQTMENIYVINAITTTPIYRPLIGLDKQEIIDLAVQIGTYETSILPYQDCCTVFIPKNPATRPTLEQVSRAEAELDIEGLVQESLANIEVLELSKRS